MKDEREIGRELGLRQAANLVRHYAANELEVFDRIEDPGRTVFGLSEQKLTELIEEIVRLISEGK